MDITIKVKDHSGKMYSQTFIGDKEQILPLMQDYIKDNQHHYTSISSSPPRKNLSPSPMTNCLIRNRKDKKWKRF
jgi:hypothetical protein